MIVRSKRLTIEEASIEKATIVATLWDISVVRDVIEHLPYFQQIRIVSPLSSLRSVQPPFEAWKPRVHNMTCRLIESLSALPSLAKLKIYSTDDMLGEVLFDGECHSSNERRKAMMAELNRALGFSSIHEDPSS